MFDDSWPRPSGFAQATDMEDICGVDPRSDPEVVKLYRELRDARSGARAKERDAETDPANISGLPAREDWQNVERLATDILSSHSKDVEVAVWLTEAVTRLYGFEGLEKSIALIADMVEAHGLDLHPRPEDADDDTFASIGGLNGVGRSGTLLQPLRLLPLAPGNVYGTNSLWHIESLGQDAEVQHAMNGAGRDAMLGLMRHIRTSRDAITRADAVLTALRGSDAPPFTQLLEIIDDAERILRRLGGINDLEVEQTEESSSERPQSTASPAIPSGAITSRDAAFARILEVAAYFRKTEPHSPIADSLETLVRRGRMDFISLISELIPDDMARKSVLTTAGIQKIEQPDTDE